MPGKKKDRETQKYFEHFIIPDQETLNLTLCYYLNICKILIKYLTLNEILQELNNETLTQITLHSWKEREVNCCFTLTLVHFPPRFLQRSAGMRQKDFKSLKKSDKKKKKE